MKVCVFVDGENFRHSIVRLFPEFNQDDYLPKYAKWDTLFDWIVRSVDEEGKRVRTYWYMIKGVDFYPHYIPNAKRLEEREEERESFKNLLLKEEYKKDEFETLENETLIEKLKEISAELWQYKVKMQNRCEGWVKVQDSIALRHKAVEFRRSGMVTCNLFDRKLGSEKTVDVKLATDMIILSDIYDTAVIVSGDQDYVPAVEVIKDYGKEVINVAFLTRNGKLLPGGAKRLNQVTDRHLAISYDSLAEHLKIGQTTMDSATMDSTTI